MNHTHYALLNEDNDVVAVVVRENFKARVVKAIEDETGSLIENLDLQEADYMNYKVKADLEDGFKYEGILRPTWEY